MSGEQKHEKMKTSFENFLKYGKLPRPRGEAIEE
jgi:hypothetical protein